jgi:hypothetical protein
MGNSIDGYQDVLAAATEVSNRIKAAQHSQNLEELLQLADALEVGLGELITTAAAAQADLDNPKASQPNRLMAAAAQAACKRAVTTMAVRLTGGAR